MNKLVVVAKNKDTYFIKRLSEEVGDSAVLFNPWLDYQIPEAQKYLVRTTGVYGNDLDLHVLGTLSNEKLINPLHSLKIFRSKPSQYEWLESKDLQTPEWIDLKSVDQLTVERFFRLFPDAVVKPQIGQGGWGIEKMTWDYFKTWWKKKKGVDENYILQRFISNALELRCFFIKGDLRVTLERKSKTSIAANFKKQGQASIVELPTHLGPVIEKIIELSGLYYGAIDLLVEGDEVYFLDINAVPGIEQLEAVSHQNIMRKLLTANFFSQLF